jgi:transcription-repair coupling factor (superfamily II helicase)
MTFEVAHGQLDEKAARERMLSFLRGDADVLVRTSIIESGIDIPQANTLIVERSDMFGLSQLYQIRGRVGRSRERAFAYLLYPSAAALTPDAANRLSALSDYTELGRRLQGRHARPRAARRGQPARRRAVRPRRRAGLRALHADARRGDPGARGHGRGRARAVRLDINVDAYVPADYVPYEQAKVDVHRRIAGAVRGRRPRGAALRARGPLRPVPEPLAEPPALQRAASSSGRRGHDVSASRAIGSP